MALDITKLREWLNSWWLGSEDKPAPDMTPPTASQEDKERINAIVGRIWHSPTGRELLENGHKAGFRIAFDNLGKKVPLGKFNDRTSVITMPGYASDGVCAISLIMSLRGIAQNTVPALRQSDEYTVISQIHIMRARTADQFAHAMQIGHELKAGKHESDENPNASIWTNASQRFPAMAKGYSDGINHKRSSEPGDNSFTRALTGAFKAYYHSPTWLAHFDNLVIDRIEKLESLGLFKTSDKFFTRKLDTILLRQSLEHANIKYLRHAGIHFEKKDYSGINRRLAQRVREVSELLGVTVAREDITLQDDDINVPPPTSMPHVDDEELRMPSLQRIDLVPTPKGP